MSDNEIENELFPKGLPSSGPESDLVFDLYKLMVASSESLVERRQGVNTFFLTLNGALVSGMGLVVGKHGQSKLIALGILTLSLVGMVLAYAWRSLLTSFGQLNTGKFKVINRLEKFLPAAIYAAEWKALGEGKQPKLYRSFTERESWIPLLFFIVYFLAGLGSGIFVAGAWKP